MTSCSHCGKNHRSITPEQCEDRAMSEKVLQNRVRERAKRRGWRVVHIGKAMQAYDAAGNEVWLTLAEAGWPDLVLAKAGRPLIFMELKREQGTETSEQLAWLALLNQTGNYGIVIRPRHLRDGTVNAILDIGVAA